MKSVMVLKEDLKKLIPAYVMSFVLCFMLFIYEPIFMYSTNMNDMWFDIYLMIKPILIIFFSIFILIDVIYTIIYFLNKKTFKKIPIYKIVLIISFIGLVCLYIQGNYLIKNLPALDGNFIDYSKYTKDNIITLIIFIITIIITIISCKKNKIDKTIKGCTFVTLVIFGMLFVSLITTMLTTKNLYVKKEDISIVNKMNYNNISTNRNFLIFLVDAVDSKTFYKTLENNEEFKTTLNDFTYYPDTLAAYPYTRDSIPFIISGIWNENETDFPTYSTNAYNNSPLLKRLQEENYSINLYEDELIWNGKKDIKIDNIGTIKKIKPFKFLKQEAKYILFKYLPFNLKKYSRIETMNFIRCSDKYVDDVQNWKNNTKAFAPESTFKSNNILNYIDIKNNKTLTKQETNYFHFLHIDGAHVPFNLDKNLNKIKNGKYTQKIEASLTILDLYIKRLKENNSYDNSAIIIMSDHGYYKETGEYSEFDRLNPILFIKGVNEHHDMQISDKAISFEDLNNAYNDLLDGKQSTEIFTNIGSERTRRTILTVWLKEDFKSEIEVTGKSWDISKFKPTGKEYNR